MNGTLKFAAPLIAVIALGACNAGGSSSLPGTPGESTATTHSMPEWQAKGLAHAACPQIVGRPSCQALIVDNKVNPQCVGAQCGFAPADLQAAYNLPSSTKGNTRVVAIVDFYDDPNVTNDLAVYRSQFGLGTAKFNKLNEDGVAGNYPPPNAGWAGEISLDVDMVSAICPKCTIDLIEADPSGSGEAAEATAAKLAHVVTNSWSCPGSIDCGVAGFGNSFNVPHVVFLASSGDGGYGFNNIGAPGDLATVVSVGGTQLSKSGSTYAETAWVDAGSGCATGVTKPTWQHDTGCSYRTQTDISSEAGCSPGVATYDTYQSGGWGGACGTSASSPTIAAVFALAGNAPKLVDAKRFYKLSKKQRSKELHDVTKGTNGSCGGSYLCVAGTGYDGPTGWGTPNGVSAF